MSSPFLKLMAQRKPMEAPIGAQEAGLLRPAAGGSGELPGGPLQSWALPPLAERDKPIESVPGPQDLLMAAPMAASLAKGGMGSLRGLMGRLRTPVDTGGALPPLPMSGPGGPGQPDFPPAVHRWLDSTLPPDSAGGGLPGDLPPLPPPGPQGSMVPFQFNDLILPGSSPPDVRVAPSVGPVLKAAGTNPGRLRRR